MHFNSLCFGLLLLQANAKLMIQLVSWCNKATNVWMRVTGTVDIIIFCFPLGLSYKKKKKNIQQINLHLRWWKLTLTKILTWTQSHCTLLASLSCMLLQIFVWNIELYWTSWTGGFMWCISHPPLESNKDLIDWI